MLLDGERLQGGTMRGTRLVSPGRGSLFPWKALASSRLVCLVVSWPLLHWEWLATSLAFGERRRNGNKAETFLLVGQDGSMALCAVPSFCHWCVRQQSGGVQTCIQLRPPVLQAVGDLPVGMLRPSESRFCTCTTTVTFQRLRCATVTL